MDFETRLTVEMERLRTVHTLAPQKSPFLFPLPGAFSLPPSTDLIRGASEIAVMGIQVSEDGVGHDLIYLITQGASARIIEERFEQGGRMWPTSITGSTLQYAYMARSNAQIEVRSLDLTPYLERNDRNA